MAEKKKMPCEDAMLENPVVSSQECTGITQTVPDGEYEASSYRALYDLPVSHREVQVYLDSLPPRIRKKVKESGIPLDSVTKIEEYVDRLR